MGTLVLAIIIAVLAYVVFLKLVLVGSFWAFIIAVVVFFLVYGVPMYLERRR